MYWAPSSALNFQFNIIFYIFFLHIPVRLVFTHFFQVTPILASGKCVRIQMDWIWIFQNSIAACKLIENGSIHWVI